MRLAARLGRRELQRLERRARRHRPSAAERPPRPLRAEPGRPHRRRRPDHRRRDLARARPGQLRQPDDVDSGRPHPGHGRGRDRRGLLQAGGQDVSAGGLERRAGQQHAGPVPAPAGHRPAARAASDALARYNAEMGPPTFAPLLFGLVGGMGLAGLGPAPRETEAMGLTPGSAEQRFPGYDVMRQQPAWDEVTTVGRDCAASARRPATVLHAPRRSPSPAPCWTGSWPRTTTPGCPSSRSSTSVWPSVVATGSATTTCPRTRRHGGSPIAALDDDARAATSGGRFAQLDAPRATRHHRRGPAVQGRLARAAGRTRLLTVDALRLQRLLLPSLGLERDRLRRARLSAGLQVPRLRAHASPGRSPERDADDPVPWAERAEAAKKRHADGLPRPIARAPTGG